MHLMVSLFLSPARSENGCALNAAIADQLADCQPDDPAEFHRYLAINGALSRCAELYSAALGPLDVGTRG